jgi:hypothetical protein
MWFFWGIYILSSCFVVVTRMVPELCALEFFSIGHIHVTVCWVFFFYTVSYRNLNLSIRFSFVKSRIEFAFHCHYWLIICCFTSRWRIFHLHGEVTIDGEGLQNLGQWAFEQGGIFIVPHLLWHRTSVFPVSSEGPPHSVAFYDYAMGCEGPMVTRVLMGLIIVTALVLELCAL